MASIIVKDINYITTGKKQKFVSLDIGYTADEFGLSVLAPEENVYDGDELYTFLGENGTAVMITRSYDDAYAAEFFMNYAYIPDMVYAASIEENLDKYTDTVTNKNNIYSVFQKDKGNVVHNLYDIRDLAVKANNRQHECTELYGPTLQKSLFGIVQHGNYTYGLTEIDGKTINYARSSIQFNKDQILPIDITDIDYYMQISADDLYTYIYKPVSMSSTNMQKNYIPNTNLSGLSCNYVFELQNGEVFNDFEEGDIYGDAFAGKYAFNATYSMDMVKDSEFDKKAKQLSIDNYIELSGYPKQALVNCRRYIGIDKCADTLFLKYYDDIWYNKTKSALSTDGNVQIRQDNENFQFTKYQKIETIKSINRFVPNTSHKTNMFSIRIADTSLSSESANSKLAQLKNMMMQDIKNNIKLVVDKVCPAHTQLLNIEFQ